MAASTVQSQSKSVNADQLLNQLTADKITAAVRRETGGLIRGLDIDSNDRQITISGSTDLYYHKQLATRAALATDPDRVIQNQIVVFSD